MKKWIVKAVVQKVISYLPYKHKINYLFQKYITKGVYLSNEYFEDRLSHAYNHINTYNKFAASTKGITTLELGTGWYPVVPISLFLTGAKKIYTVDISALCDKKKLLKSIEMFIQYKEMGKLNFSSNILPERFKVLDELYKSGNEISFESILEKLNIVYLVKDARNLSLESGSIDLIHSNNTFEHVYPKILESLLVEFRRLSKAGGIMSHFVDMSDHFAHFDKSITIYNFLKFSKRQWKFIDNSVQPQNRWRVLDYKMLYEKLGINVVEIIDIRMDEEEIRLIQLNDEYNNLDIKEIAISHCRLISVKK